MPSVFKAGVAFNSICCGPADAGFLKTILKSKDFKRIKAFKASGCGREGEFRILFTFKGVKTAMVKKFMKKLQEKVAKQDAINRANNASTGNMEVLENIKKEELDVCRMGIIAWK